MLTAIALSWGLGCSRSNPSLPHGEKLLNVVSAPAVTALPKSLLELKQAYLSLRLEQSCFVKKVNVFTGQDRKLRKPLQVNTDETQA